MSITELSDVIFLQHIRRREVTVIRNISFLFILYFMTAFGYFHSKPATFNVIVVDQSELNRYSINKLSITISETLYKGKWKQKLLFFNHESNSKSKIEFLINSIHQEFRIEVENVPSIKIESRISIFPIISNSVFQINFSHRNIM